uniref:Uncharacterized protein n=1 Tax=Leersia perrieri TaxID=77586 RepID=A0A0D9WUT1_9ORYZ
MAAWMLRSAAAAAAAGRAIRRRRRSYHSDGGPPPKLRGPRFSPFNRHLRSIPASLATCCVDALLEEVKNTPVGMISDDLMIRTLRHSILARQQILVQNVLRSWVVAAAVISGYCWGYNIVAQSSTVGPEPPKEHEGN